jgi:fused signal recognition particle receptor
MEEELDALILELIKEKMDNVRDEVTSLIEAHSADPAAHPHAHDLDVSAAVEEHLSNASAEIEAALNAEPPAPEPTPEPEPEPEPEPTPPAPAAEERVPDRTHALHRRIG